MSDLGNKIKQIRIARGYTQDDIADMMDVKRTTISNWEKNVRMPSADKLIQYSKIVGVTLDYFSENTPERTLFQTLTQLENLFTSANVPEADKDKAYQDIMKIYLRSKELASSPTPTPSPAVEEVRLDAKEE